MEGWYSLGPLPKPALGNLLLMVMLSTLQTFLWVINHDDEFEYAFDELGVAGVMTDYPTKLREFLDRRQSTQSEKEPLRSYENKYTQ